MDNIDDVIHSDDPFHASVGIHHRDGQQRVLGKQQTHILLIHLLGHRHDLGLHEVTDFHTTRCFEELSERYHPDQTLLGIEDVHIVDRLDTFARLLMEITDGFVSRHVRAHAGKTRAHEAPRFVLRVCQEGGHLFPG